MYTYTRVRIRIRPEVEEHWEYLENARNIRICLTYVVKKKKLKRRDRGVKYWRVFL